MQQNNNRTTRNNAWPSNFPKLRGEVAELALLHFQIRDIFAGLEEFLFREYRIKISAVEVPNRTTPVSLLEKEFIDIINFLT